MSEIGSVDEVERGGGSYFAALREQSRLRRDVVAATRKSMRGRTPAEIAGELERALLGADRTDRIGLGAVNRGAGPMTFSR